jgi:hypothetical protein
MAPVMLVSVATGDLPFMVMMFLLWLLVTMCWYTWHEYRKQTAIERDRAKIQLKELKNAH